MRLACWRSSSESCWCRAARRRGVGEGLLRFVYLVGAGIATGMLVAEAASWVERKIDDGPIEIAISVMVPYAAYLGAELVHASGVLAVVTCGLILSRRSAVFFSPAVRLQVYAECGARWCSS